MRHLKKQSNQKNNDKIKHNFFVFDTETKKGSQGSALEPMPKNFVFGVLYGYNFQKVFYTVDEFKKEFKLKKYDKKYIFAHNAEFDLTCIYGNLYKHLDSKVIFNGRFISAKNNGVTFADSMNIFEGSVQKMGIALGIEKIENDKVKDSGLTKENLTNEDIEYCKRDCEIVFDTLLKFFEYAGCIKITLGSLSLYNFRNKFLAENIIFSELVDEFYDSYYGGRTEVFKLGKTESKVYDVNSLYPSVMLNMRFPDVRNLKKFSTVDVKYFLYILKYNEGLAKVTIKHKETYFGYLPYKTDKLLFPIGTFTGIYNFNELRFAIEAGIVNIIKVDYVVYSNPVSSPFTEFVKFHYNARLAANNDMDKWIEKYTLNKLYGKFAQRVKYTTEYFEDIPFQIIEELKKTEKFYSLKTFSEKRDDCFLITENDKFKNSFFAIPTFSSYITSEARIVLLKALIQNEKNDIVYCDTDSIFIEKNFQGNISKELGDFKEENKIVLEINGLKNYVYKDLQTLEIKETIKGVNKRSVKIGENKYQVQKYYKTKEALRRGKEAGESFIMTKELTHVYDKRIVNKSDGSTKPIKLNIL